MEGEGQKQNAIKMLKIWCESLTIKVFNAYAKRSTNVIVNRECSPSLSGRLTFSLFLPLSPSSPFSHASLHLFPFLCFPTCDLFMCLHSPTATPSCRLRLFMLQAFCLSAVRGIIFYCIWQRGRESGRFAQIKWNAKDVEAKPEKKWSLYAGWPPLRLPTPFHPLPTAPAATWQQQQPVVVVVVVAVVVASPFNN